MQLSFNNFIFKEFKKNDEENKIRSLIDGSGMLFFFQFEKQIFGAGEDGRITFARIKNPNKEDKEWTKEASFNAVNLTKLMEGENSRSIFGQKDLNKIKVISSEKVVNLLHKKSNNMNIGLKVGQKDHKPDNFIQTMEM